MSVIETTRPMNSGSIGGLIGRSVAAFATWNDARVTRKALNRLSDRELDDIGLSRADIDRITARA